jgi:kynureninase
VLVQDTTSVNFYRACRAALAARPGRRTIVSDAANFPTDRYIVEGIAAELGLKLVLIDDEVTRDSVGRENEIVTPERLAPYLSDDVALVTLSVIAYRSGGRHDVAAITDVAHRYGALTVWDASHAVGAIDLQFDRDGVDLAVGCTYKYGNSGPGAPAWLYITKALQAALDLPIHGWFGQREQFAMGQGFQRTDGIRGFQIASPSVMGLLCVQSGFAMIERAGMLAISDKAAHGTDVMISLFDEWLAPLGFRLMTPRTAQQRGGHLTLHHPDGAAIARGLRVEHKVVPDFREPGGIRIAMSPLPTSYREVFDGLARIRDFTASGGFQRYQGLTSVVS